MQGVAAGHKTRALVALLRCLILQEAVVYMGLVAHAQSGHKHSSMAMQSLAITTGLCIVSSLVHARCCQLCNQPAQCLAGHNLIAGASFWAIDSDYKVLSSCEAQHTIQVAADDEATLAPADLRRLAGPANGRVAAAGNGEAVMLSMLLIIRSIRSNAFWQGMPCSQKIAGAVSSMWNCALKDSCMCFVQGWFSCWPRLEQCLVAQQWWVTNSLMIGVEAIILVYISTWITPKWSSYVQPLARNITDAGMHVHMRTISTCTPCPAS